MLVSMLPPTAPGVMTQAAAGNGYIGYYDGGAYGIPHSSKNKEATMLWLQFVAMNEHQADWAIAGGRITHKVHMLIQKLWLLTSKQMVTLLL